MSLLLNKYKVFIIIRYTLLIECILFNSNIIFSQNIIKSFQIKTTNNDCSLTLIKTNDNRIMFFDNNASNEYIYIYEIKNNSKLIIDTINNVFLHNQYYSAPFSILFIKDTFFISFGRDLSIATNNNGKYKIIKTISTNDINNEPPFDYLIAYKDNLLICAESEWYHNKLEHYKDYHLTKYNIRKNKVIKRTNFDLGNGILLNTNHGMNIFSSNNNYIAIMNPIKPITYILDYNFNIVDSIIFSKSIDFIKSNNILDSLCNTTDIVAKSEYSPKTMIYTLEEVLHFQENYYMNIKQHFVDTYNLLICYKKQNTTNMELINVNIKSKKITPLFTFNKKSPYIDIYYMHEMPVLKNGILFYQSEKLTKDEENIINSLDMYYSKQLDFSTNK